MSFIGETMKGKCYAPGFFLAHEECERKSREIPQSLATTTPEGAKYVKAGTVYPSNDSSATGIVYEDVDVTNGNMIGSVIVSNGAIYEDRLPVSIDSDAKSALIAKGFTFTTSPSVDR